MARFEENFRGGRAPVICKLCHGHLDNQERSFEFKVIKEKVEILGNYQDIFNPSSPELPRLAKTISKITQLRSELLENV